MYSRYVLRPDGNESAALLSEINGKKTVVPLDMALGIDNLPFKITPSMMLEIAYWAARMNSYQDAEDYFKRSKGISLSDDTIRGVVNVIGKIVHDDDHQKAQNARRIYANRTPASSCRRDGVLYLQVEEDSLSAANDSKTGTCDCCVKLAFAFAEDTSREKKPGSWQVQHRKTAGEYIGCIGSRKEFQDYLLALAIRAGYGLYRKTVIISDGSEWIREMAEELFPDAQQICNLPSPKDKADPIVIEEGPIAGVEDTTTGVSRISLQNRIKLSGPHWNASTAQYMLALKTKTESGLWEKSVVPLVMQHFDSNSAPDGD